MDVDLQKCLEVAEAAARAAGAEIAGAWDGDRNVEYKGAVDLVTETDKKCEAIIFAQLSAAFPGKVLQVDNIRLTLG